MRAQDLKVKNRLAIDQILKCKNHLCAHLVLCLIPIRNSNRIM